MNKLSAEIPFLKGYAFDYRATGVQIFGKKSWFHLKGSIRSWNFLTLEVGPHSYYET